MSSIDIPKENLSKQDKINVPLPSKVHKFKKCLIRKSIGIITPRESDNFPFISFNYDESEKNEDENHQNNSSKNIIKINIVDNNNNIIWSKNPFLIQPIKMQKEKIENNKEQKIPSFKATQEFIRLIDQDSIENILPCKPMLSSTASKTYMLEYSKSKKYKEDSKNFNLSFEESRNSPSSEVTSNKSNNFSRSSTATNTILEEEDSIYDLREILKYQEEHLVVPISQKDNENYKILTMKKLKRKSMPPNKSLRKFAEDMEPKYEKEFRVNNSYYKLLKKKMVHSSMRVYSSSFILGDEKNHVNFMIYRDKDIGVYEYWQAHIHESRNDEDIETEDDQKRLAGIFVLGEIKEAFSFIKNRNVEDIFVNFYRYNKFRSNEENERINTQILDLKNKIFL